MDLIYEPDSLSMFSSDDFKIICSHAVREYPFECCGLVSRSKEGLNMVHMCSNVQNELHKKDPATYPKDARVAYSIDPGEYAVIEREIMERGASIVGLYHSHPDHDAYFSDTDRSMALMFDEPVFPEAEYLVVSVYRGATKRALSFKWDEESREFRERRVFNRLT